MWDWIESKATAASKWYVDNKSTISAVVSAVAGALVAVAVGVAVGAFVAGTFGIGGVALVAIAGVAAGASGAATGYCADFGQEMDPNVKFDGKKFIRVVAVGAVIGGLTAGAGDLLSGTLGKGANVVVNTATEYSGVALSEGTKKVAVKVTEKALESGVGSVVGATTQVVDNVIASSMSGTLSTDNPFRGTGTAAALGFATTLVQSHLEQVARTRIEAPATAAGEATAAAMKTAKQAASDAVGSAKAAASRAIASVRTPLALPVAGEATITLPAARGAGAPTSDSAVASGGSRGPLAAQDGLAQALDPEIARGNGGGDPGADAPAAPATIASQPAPEASPPTTPQASTPGALGDTPPAEVASAPTPEPSVPAETPPASTSRVKLADGTDRVVGNDQLGPAPAGKPRGLSKASKANLAASAIDKAMGLGMVPETTVRTLDGKTVVAQAPATGDSPAALRAARNPVLDSAAFKRATADMNAFDYVTGNRSRGDNYLVDPATGKITLADNGFPGSATSARPSEVTADFVAKTAKLADPALATKLQGAMTPDQLKGAQARARELSDGLLDGSIKEVE